MAKELTRAEKKELAKALYLSDKGKTQKEVAKAIGVTEATVSKWAADDKWSELRDSLVLTRDEQLSRLYAQLRAFNDYIDTKEEKLRFPTSKEADALRKISKSIKDLEVETSIAETIEVLKKVLDFIRPLVPFEQAQAIRRLFDQYVKNVLK